MTATQEIATNKNLLEGQELSPAAFSRLARFITGELGIKMPDSKFTMVQNRLQRRVRDLKMKSIDQYADYFFSAANSTEREHFINVITTNKTDFFREPEHFNFLVEEILPHWMRKSNRGGRFQVWSAGCSSGEEPYTLAMVLSEYMASQRAGFDFAILGTDVSTRVLNRARNGIYPESQIQPISLELRRKYLLRGRDESGNLARIVPQLRSKISLHHLNLMQASYPINATFDVIFFRNVLIYFDRSTQEAVIRKMSRHLAPGGYLFTGLSESLAGLDIPVVAVKTSVYRKPGGR